MQSSVVVKMKHWWNGDRQKKNKICQNFQHLILQCGFMYAVSQAFKCPIHGFMYTVHSTAGLISLPSNWGMRYSIETGFASSNAEVNYLCLCTSDLSYRAADD